LTDNDTYSPKTCLFDLLKKDQKLGRENDLFPKTRHKTIDGESDQY
jgi:hypothetical protein